MKYPVTSDGRYFIVRNRLWRMSNPALSEEARKHLTKALMAARRAVGVALRSRDDAALKKARDDVNRAKVALGERGPVWWTDGTPDFNRHLLHNTPYASELAAEASQPPDGVG